MASSPPIIPGRRQRDADGFARDMQSFIVDMEASANHIIKRETKRRLSELRRQAQVEAVQMRVKGGQGRSRKRPMPLPSQSPGRNVPPPPIKLAGPGSNGPAVTFTRTDMTASVSRLLPCHSKFVDTPSRVKVGTDPFAVTAVPEWANDGVGKPGSVLEATSAGVGGQGPLPPVQATGSKSSSTIRRVLEGVIHHVKAASEPIVPVLFKNPLYKPKGIGSKTKGAREIRSDMKGLYSTSTGTGGMMTMGPAASNTSAPKPRVENQIELQGPISWCSDDIRTKYRCEEAREAAWLAGVTAQAVSEKLRVTEGVIMPYPIVERHPLYIAYFNLVKADFRRAIDRARARNRLKRFVSDVHTVWMTNLAALREFSFQRHEAPPRGKGVDQRRDVPTIVSLSSQIQSISADRSGQGGIYSAHKEFPLVTSAPVFTRDTPTLPPLPPPPAWLWCLVNREPVHVKSVQRQYHCFVHRLVAPQGEGDRSPPMWRISFYDRSDGTDMSVVALEEAVVLAVRKHILHSSEHNFHELEEVRRAWVHKQVKRVDLAGGGKAFSLLQVSVYGGPHDTVLVEITAFPYSMQALGKLVLRVTTEEVKARLSLLDDVPARDLGWWRASRHRLHDAQSLWKPLISLLQLKTRVQEDGCKRITELVFNDQHIRDKEGFDMYGMMATAHALLPLARVTPVQRRNGVGFSLAFPDVTPEVDPPEGWEGRADFHQPLSVRVSGYLSKLGHVPGICTTGKQGLWYRSPASGQELEYTRAAACHFRDRSMSSTDSVLTLVVLGMDTPTVTPTVVAWETDMCDPPSPPEEQPSGVVPCMGTPPLTSLKAPLISPVDSVMAPTLMALTAMSTVPDYGPADALSQTTRGLHRRHDPALDLHGFELQSPVTTVVPKNETPTYIFTITERGATPNLVRTTGRYIWHSEQRCLEEIVRRRTPKDFAYVSKKRKLLGGNNPRTFTAFTRHGKFDRLVSGGYQELLRQYEVIRAREEKRRKEEALKAKMEAASALVGAHLLQDTLASSVMEGKSGTAMGEQRAPAHKRSSLERWKKRLAHSVLIGSRGVWEKRKHEASGNIFYYCGDHGAVASDRFTHDPPQSWLDVHDTARNDHEQMMVSREPSMAPSNTTPSSGIVEGTSAGGGSLSEGDARALGDVGKKQAKHIEEILDDLASNDLLISKLAEKIGAQSFVPLLKRDSMVEPLERQLEEDDRAWSDSDDEVGDDEYEEGYLLQDWQDKYQEEQSDKALFDEKASVHIKPEIVPRLPIKDMVKHDTSGLGGHILGKGWRRLPRPEIKAGFIAKMLRTRTERSHTGIMDKASSFHLIGCQSPGDALVDTEQWTSGWASEVRFIDNVLQDVEMSVELIQARFEREEKLAKGGGLSQILASGGLDMGGEAAIDRIKAAQDQADLADNLYKAEKKALSAVSAGDLQTVEECVDDDHINLNAMDQHGNTLLILAAQQGNKRMVKFLLRRGANINMQNFAGNSVLHYAYAYNHEELGRYLESKGADNSLVNAEGLTCYEGLKRLQLANI